MKSLPELEALLAAAKAATPGPWQVSIHASGTTNVVIRTGDCWNEHGPGMLYASIILYNMGAYSDGATEDGVQVERQRCAAHIAAFDPTTAAELVEELIALRKRCKQWEEWRRCAGPMPKRQEADRARE